MKITELFVKIQDTAGTNDKKQLLKDNLNPTIQQIFEDTYGSQKYYIKQFFPVLNLFGTLTLDNDYNVFHEALTRLSNREVTGNEAIGFITGVFYKFDTDSQQILRGIIDRNLKIGLSYDGYLNVIGTKESKFEVALAENLNNAKNVDPLDGSYFISRKLDGCVDRNSIIKTDIGDMTIGYIIDNNIKCKVESWDGDKIVYKPIKSTFCGDTGKQWYNIILDNGKTIKITENDRLMTNNGWKFVKDLTINDKIMCNYDI